MFKDNVSIYKTTKQEGEEIVTRLAGLVLGLVCLMAAFINYVG